MSRIIDHVAGDDAIRPIIVTAFWKGRGVPVGDLESTLQEFTAAGKNVFITDDVPDFPFDPVQCRDRKVPVIAVTECTQGAAEYRPAYKSYVSDLQQVVNAVPGVQMLATHKYFCSVETCSMTNGEDLLYRDYNHLNMNGTRLLAQRLKMNTEFAEAMTPR
jgi:hypothetical protein